MAIVPIACLAIEPDQPYSTEHGSILGDLINQASHGHGLYPADNAEIYFKLEEATHGTSFTDSIKPFARAKNGRAAFLALTTQYAGKDKWEAQIKTANTILFTRKWKGSQGFPLEKFAALHRNAYVSLVACAEHVEYQLPNAHSRVGYLLDAIESDDAGLQAAMANVEDDTGVGGKRGEFEAAVAYLLPKDPVVKRKQTDGKRLAGEISDTSATVGDFGTKPGIGKTGVHLRYHSNPEYFKLKPDQRQELREWRKLNPDKAKAGKDSDPKKRARQDKKAMTAAIKKGVEKELKQAAALTAAEREGEDLLDQVFALSAAGRKAPPAVAAAAAGTPTQMKEQLRSILKKAKAASVSGNAKKNQE